MGGLFLRCLWKDGGGTYSAGRSKGVGALRTRYSRKVEGHTPVGTSHDVTAQNVGRVPPVGTIRHVPKNYRGVVMIGTPGGALRVTFHKNRGESCVNFTRLYATLLNITAVLGTKKPPPGLETEEGSRNKCIALDGLLQLLR